MAQAGQRLVEVHFQIIGLGPNDGSIFIRFHEHDRLARAVGNF